MKKITLARALKLKNRLVRKMSDLRLTLQRCNCTVEENKFDYDFSDTYDEFYNVMDDLIKIKAVIQKANQPIMEKIFTMGEYRSLINTLNTVNTKSGKQLPDRFGASDAFITYKCQYDRASVDELMNMLQDSIDEIQDEIDVFNHTTEVEVELETI